MPQIAHFFYLDLVDMRDKMGNVRFHFGNRLVNGVKDEKTPGFQFDDLSPDYADLHGVFRFFGSFYDAFCR